MEAASPSPRQFPRHWLVWIALLPLLILVFHPAWNAPFLLDDSSAIQGNSEIRKISVDNLIRIVRGHRDVRAIDHHPVSALSFMIDYQWTGLDPYMLHVSNLIYHWIAAGCIFWLALSILRTIRGDLDDSSFWLAAAIMAVWAVHPLATMPVSYITCRQETLLVLLYSAALAAFLNGYLLLSIGFGVASFLCKEVAVTLPGAIVMLDWARGGQSWFATLRNRWHYYLSLTLIWLTICMYHLRGGRRHEVFAAGMPLATASEYLKVQCGVVLNYFRKVFWPSDLVFYPHFRPVESLQQWVPACIALVLIALIAVAAIRWSRWLAVALFFPFLVLSPTSSVIPIPFEAAMDYRMYLPAVAWIGVVLYLLWKYVPNQWARLGVVVAMIIPLGIVSHMRTRDYETARKLYEHDEKINPNGLNTLEALAGIYTDLKMFDKAEEKAWRLIDWGMADNNKDMASRGYTYLGLVSFRRNNIPVAKDFYRRAIRLNSNRSAQINLATVLVDQNELEEAEKLLRGYLETSPDNQEALLMLYETQISRDELEEAERTFEHFMQLYPERMDMDDQRTRILNKKRNRKNP